MDLAVECTCCGVLMTSWTAPGRTIRCWKCPSCHRTYSAPVARAPVARATSEELHWSQLKNRAARWFERLEREGRVAPAGLRRLSAAAVAAAAARGR